MATLTKAQQAKAKEKQKLSDKIKILFPQNAKLLTKIFFSFYYFAIPATIISWIAEIAFGTSICAFILPNLSCPVILRADVVLEVIKAVGLSTAFIMLVYNSLDKYTLGIRYSEIIQHNFSYYWICSVIHVTFTLSGIASGVAGASESALAALFIILFGLFIQWKVVYNVILDKSACQRLADSLWKHKIEDQASAQEIREILQDLAAEMGKSNGHIPNVLMNRFAHALVMFASKAKINIRVSHISEIWAIVLHGRSDSNIGIRTGEILSACMYCSDVPLSMRKDALISICGGYIVYRIQHELPNIHSVEDKLAMIAESIACLFYRISVDLSSEEQNVRDYVYHCMCTIFTAIAWVAFFRSQITLNDKILSLKELAGMKKCKMCIFETARAIFPLIDGCADSKLDLLVEKAYNFTIQAAVRK